MEDKCWAWKWLPMGCGLEGRKKGEEGERKRREVAQWRTEDDAKRTGSRSLSTISGLGYGDSLIAALVCTVIGSKIIVISRRVACIKLCPYA